MLTTLYLNDAKVFKATGGKGHLGLPVPGATTRVTAGVKWDWLSQDQVPDHNVIVKPHYSLVRVGRGTYELEVADKWYARTAEWLHARCA